jgi:Flp pilus assembly protein TadG
MRLLARLCRDSRGAAAAEMAMVTPFLVLLMFGSFELGKYFWDEHIVVKAVRDGARFAARQSFASMPCPSGPATNETQIKNVVMYGKPTVTAADKSRLYYWTDPATVAVDIDCYDNAGTDGARVYDGVYSDRAVVPRVTVRAQVPYSPIVGGVMSLNAGANLNAEDQATVFGI